MCRKTESYCCITTPKCVLGVLPNLYKPLASIFFLIIMTFKCFFRIDLLFFLLI